MIDPQSDLGKLLLVLVQEIGSSIAPSAFKEINVENAIRQADEAVKESDTVSRKAK